MIAREQRVSPLLLRALDGAGVDGPWRADLHADAARCRARAALVLPALAELGLRPLVDAGFQPVVMKGASIVGRYPAPGLRPMDDVDVVVARRDLDAAVRVLRREGWDLYPVPGGAHHETAMVHPRVADLPIEVHSSFAILRTRSNRLRSDEMWRRRVPLDVCGVGAFRFADADEIVFLAAHAAKPFHVFDRLLWSVDVAVVVEAAARSGSAVDWDQVAALSQAGGCRSAVGVALAQAARLGATVPAALCTSPASRFRRALLEPLFSADWPVLERHDDDRSRWQYALMDDPRFWVVLLTQEGRVRSPTEAARTAVSLSRRWLRLHRAREHRVEDARHRVEP